KQGGYMGSIQQWAVSFVAGAVLAAGGPARMAQAASDVDIVLDKLVERSILSNVDAASIRQEIADSKKSGAAGAHEVVAKDSQRITLGGDLRLRDEYRNRTSASDANRQR